MSHGISLFIFFSQGYEANCFWCALRQRPAFHNKSLSWKVKSTKLCFLSKQSMIRLHCAQSPGCSHCVLLECSAHLRGDYCSRKGLNTTFACRCFWNIFSSLYLSFSQRMLCFDVSIIQIILTLRWVQIHTGSGKSCPLQHWRRRENSPWNGIW